MEMEKKEKEKEKEEMEMGMEEGRFIRQLIRMKYPIRERCM